MTITLKKLPLLTISSFQQIGLWMLYCFLEHQNKISKKIYLNTTAAKTMPILIGKLMLSIFLS